MRQVEGIKIYTVIETANLLGVTYQTVRNYIKEGRLHGQQIGRPIVITDHAIKDFLLGDKEINNTESRV